MYNATHRMACPYMRPLPAQAAAQRAAITSSSVHAISRHKFWFVANCAGMHCRDGVSYPDHGATSSCVRQDELDRIVLAVQVQARRMSCDVNDLGS